jgi:hypothetical protein
LESGLPRFRPGFTCPALLRNQPDHLSFSSTGLSPYVALLSRKVRLKFLDRYGWPYNPNAEALVWALPSSLAATEGISFDFFSSAYLDVSVRQVSLPYPMYSDKDSGRLFPLGFPIRSPPGQSFIPAHRRFSQVSRPSSPVDT